MLKFHQKARSLLRQHLPLFSLFSSATIFRTGWALACIIPYYVCLISLWIQLRTRVWWNEYIGHVVFSFTSCFFNNFSILGSNKWKLLETVNFTGFCLWRRTPYCSIWKFHFNIVLLHSSFFPISSLSWQKKITLLHETKRIRTLKQHKCQAERIKK